jgi:erythromycin esterase-like protein
VNGAHLLTFRSFVTAFQANLRVQEQLATNRMRFSQRLQEMSDELNGLAREGEKQRKIVCWAA